MSQHWSENTCKEQAQLSTTMPLPCTNLCTRSNKGSPGCLHTNRPKSIDFLFCSSLTCTMQNSASRYYNQHISHQADTSKFLVAPQSHILSLRHFGESAFHCGHTEPEQNWHATDSSCWSSGAHTYTSLFDPLPPATGKKVAGVLQRLKGL